jgi:hypothetical protein
MIFSENGCSFFRSCANPGVLRMRKPEAAVAAARNVPLAVETPVRLVCLALLLAIAALACRIVSLW